uniref:Growth hormone protein n=3 Tax=Labeo TaxID=84644 RepID=Q90WV7_LABCA|nr:growth hormone protein [Labeo catla]AAL14247.1 growth hormone protein [Labeo catla]AAU93609.1 growth hormone [Labeo fimbriatus]AAU93900.1 growth hormone [Labeo fimbriatus]AAU93902.1 growth hormone [Labeo kontius]
MARALVLLSVVLVSLLVNQGRASDNQRLFNNVVVRVQHLHQLAAKMINDFDDNLLPEDRRLLSKTIPMSFCISDYIEAPTGKDEAQRSSMLKLLRISFRLIESWELASQILSRTVSNSLTVGSPNQINEKLADLKMGISVLIKGCLDGQPNMDDNDSLPLPFEDFYLTTEDNDLTKNFRLLACFKKDMHKVETYLRVANCRRSLDSNCTL